MNSNRTAVFCFGIQLGITMVFGTPYRCYKCDFTTENPNRRLVHIAAEHGYYCCFKHEVRYKNATVFRKHMATQHSCFICTDCNLRVFKTDEDYQRHTRKYHSEPQSSSSSSDEDESYQCPYCFQKFGKQMVLSNKWERKMHYWHRHGTLKEFFLAVLPSHRCCKPYHEKIIDCITGNTEGDIWKDIVCFSEHVYKEHENLCLLCEQKTSTPSDKLWFRQKEFIPGFVFEQARNESFLSGNRKTDVTCPCGGLLPFNAKSKLFQLRIDLLPFGRGLDTVTHPYACMTDGTKDVLGAFTTETSKEMLRPEELQSFDTGEEIPTKQNSKPQSPSFSAKSVDTTFASTDDKKHKQFPVSDTGVVSPTDNETKEDVFKNL